MDDGYKYLEEGGYAEFVGDFIGGAFCKCALAINKEDCNVCVGKLVCNATLTLLNRDHVHLYCNYLGFNMLHYIFAV